MDFGKQIGTVAWFNAKKGFGFITPDEKMDDKDIFVHFTGIEMGGYKQLQDGDRVEYALKDTDKGVVAVEVKILSSEKPSE